MLKTFCDLCEEVILTTSMEYQFEFVLRAGVGEGTEQAIGVMCSHCRNDLRKTFRMEDPQ